MAVYRASGYFDPAAYAATESMVLSSDVDGARLLAPLFRRPIAWRLLDALVAATMLALAYALLASRSA